MCCKVLCIRINVKSGLAKLGDIRIWRAMVLGKCKHPYPLHAYVVKMPTQDSGVIIKFAAGNFGVKPYPPTCQ